MPKSKTLSTQIDYFFNALLQLYTAGTITKDTLLQQLADGEVLGDDFDVQEEIDATASGGL